jgi:hypothetical protein
MGIILVKHNKFFQMIVILVMLTKFDFYNLNIFNYA